MQLHLHKLRSIEVLTSGSRGSLDDTRRCGHRTVWVAIMQSETVEGRKYENCTDCNGCERRGNRVETKKP